jgi:hypothetical protein
MLRIDPTGVCLHTNDHGLFDAQFSLRPTDAKLVVALHYNVNQLGAGRLIGGVDIKLNGGKHQPGMTRNRFRRTWLMETASVLATTSRQSDAIRSSSTCGLIATR